VFIIPISPVYRFRILDGKTPAANKNNADITIPQIRLTSKLHHASFVSSAPINCAISIPATVLTAPITTEKISEKFPHSPTADILVSPNCPIIIWSTIEKDACSILCNVTGIAILHNDFINFDIIISSYFLFLLNQLVTRFLSHILLHCALLPDIQLRFLLSRLPLDESL